MSSKDEKLNLTREELDLIRQWFNCVVDINEPYLKRPDFELIFKVLNYLGVDKYGNLEPSLSSSF